MSAERAIELQKARNWSSAKTIWEGLDAHILRDLNLAICDSWLDDCEEVLAILDRHKSWPNPLPGLSSLSPERLKMLQR